jgi:hypothetical protein
MPDGERTQAAGVAAQIAEDALIRDLFATTNRTIAQLLGFQWSPGDLVVDQVTGQSGRVLHVATHTIVRSAPRA